MRYETREIINMKLSMKERPGYQAAAGDVLLVLLSWENSRTGSTQPTQAKIAAALGLARETVCRVVGWLRRQGYIRTRQLMVRQADGTVLRGALIYWVAKDVVQAGFIRAKEAFMSRYRRLMERRLKQGTALMAVRLEEGIRATTSNTGMYERVLAQGLANSRCDLDSATPSRSESNPDKVGVGEKNWASPALLRLLKEQERRR